MIFLIQTHILLISFIFIFLNDTKKTALEAVFLMSDFHPAF
jgi:hypothetical protein